MLGLLLLTLLRLWFRFVLHWNQPCTILQISLVISEDIVDFTVKIGIQYRLGFLHLMNEEFISNLNDFVADFLEPNKYVLDQLCCNQSQMLEYLFQTLVSWLSKLLEWFRQEVHEGMH